MQTHAAPPPTGEAPSPGRIMHSIMGWQNSAVMNGAIELDLFTLLADGPLTASELASKANASERGMRILCDYLVVDGHLTKDGDRYANTPETAMFLNKTSQAYMGTVTSFLTSDHIMRGFHDVAGTVRKGGTLVEDDSGLDPEHPMWVEFARSMASFIFLPAQLTAGHVAPGGGEPLKVMDIAAGHGLFGIAIGQRNPNARIVAVDWPNVLEYAKQNADRFGMGDRYELLPGSAFEVDFGTDYDIILVPNFLHHFDAGTCTSFMRKVHGALKPGGKTAIVEFVPNDDRVSPPMPAQFSMMMLGGTPAGDAYTLRELQEILTSAGFGPAERHDLVPTPQTLVVASR